MQNVLTSFTQSRDLWLRWEEGGGKSCDTNVINGVASQESPIIHKRSSDVCRWTVTILLRIKNLVDVDELIMRRCHASKRGRELHLFCCQILRLTASISATDNFAMHSTFYAYYLRIRDRSRCRCCGPLSTPNNTRESCELGFSSLWLTAAHGKSTHAINLV